MLPPETIRVHTRDAERPPAAPGDIWALGVMFLEVLTATVPGRTLFLPEISSLEGLRGAEQLSDAVHSLIEAEQNKWVCPFCHAVVCLTSLSIAVMLCS